MKNKVRYLLVSFVGLLVAMGGLSSARAAEVAPGATSGNAAMSMQKGMKAGQGPQWVMGNIIMLKKGRIAINTENGRMRTLRIGRKTDIVVDGQAAKASELRAGDPIVASYKGHAAHPWATRLEVDRRHPAVVSGTAPATETPAATATTAAAASPTPSGSQMK